MPGIKIVNSSNITFEGLHIHEAFDYACVVSDSRDIIFRNVMIKNTMLQSPDASVLISRGTKGLVLERSVLTGTKDQRTFSSSSSTLTMVGASEVNVVHSTLE